MKCYFPTHIDGGNRGCEGIAKGTAQLLSLPKTQLVGLCSDVPLDTRLHVDDFVTLQAKRKPNLIMKALIKMLVSIFSFFNVDRYTSTSLLYRFSYSPFIKQMKKGDVMISTGGDMLCYHDNEVVYTAKQAKKKGVKTVLWGCSMGPENLTERKLETLKSFDLIYARESMSFDFFKSLGLNNVVCYPDPAFVLEKEKVDVPVCFSKGKVIGVNLSNYTVGSFNLNTSFGNEVRLLLNYIVKETDYQVLLVPHVLWGEQDDRVMAKNVADEYAQYSDRITILESDNLNYLQIRYIISLCHLFIGGRTHAVISAYSACVPTIALGYSIKSRGIAKDLGVEEFVVDCKRSGSKGLLEVFKTVDENSADIKEHLTSIMPAYIRDMKDVKRCVSNLYCE